MKLRFLLKFILMTLILLCFSQYLLAEVSLSIDPASAQLVYGDNLTLSVKVDGITTATAMGGFEIELNYDPDYLSITDFSAFVEGDFLFQKGPTQWFVRGSAGSYILSCAILSATDGATGSGTLFTVNFIALNKCTGSVGTNIILTRYILREPLNDPITVDHVTGANVKITGSQSIELKCGWNIISAYVLPLDTDMIAAFSGLMAAGHLEKVQDELGDALVKDPEHEGLWLNSLSSYDVNEGYRVKVNSPCTLVFKGCWVQLPLVIPLREGWNIVSFPFLSNAATMPLLQDLIEANQLLKVQDEDGNAITKNPDDTGWLDEIYFFKPGEGYRIKVNGDTQLTYSESGEGAKMKPQENNNNLNNHQHKRKIENR